MKNILPPQLIPNTDKYFFVDNKTKILKKIWKTNSELDKIATKLSLIFDIISSEKEEKKLPFWNINSQHLSDKLWLPKKTDNSKILLNLPQDYSSDSIIGNSWFSIKKLYSLDEHSFKLSDYSLPISIDTKDIKSKDTKSKNTKSKNNQDKQLKTLKIRLFPTDEEKKILHLSFQQFRWYYNATLNIFNSEHKTSDKILEKNKYSSISIRDNLRKYKYVEHPPIHTDKEIFILTEFVYNEKNKEDPVPDWWKGNIVNSRISRGASKKFTQNINSIITNYKNKNIKKFQMKYMTKKNKLDVLLFEDNKYPTFINKIKSTYWYRTKERKRKKISFLDIEPTRGLEVIYEKDTNKYYIHYPVDKDWYPENDIRNENQVKYKIEGNRIISLDPGVRKFLVGYDPKGNSIVIGEKSNKILVDLMYRVDEEKDDKEKYKIWRRIHNLVDELHWKTISFLIENYDVILLPDFRVQQMIKGHKLSKMTKRLMCIFSFYKFKERLKVKCKWYKKKIIIVDESYTSCTCTGCGYINETKGREELKCNKCELEIDRDIAGARNILIKNISLR